LIERFIRVDSLSGTGRAAGFSGHKFGWQLNFDRKFVAALNSINQNFDRDFAHFIKRDVDGGQHWVQIANGFHVVDAGDRNTPRNAQLIFAQGFQNANR